MDSLEKIRRGVVERNEELIQTISDSLGRNIPPLEIVEALNQGMDEVTRRWDLKDEDPQKFFRPELDLAIELFLKANSILKDKLKSEDSIAKVVLGSFPGNPHSAALARVETAFIRERFEVINFGTEIPVRKFLEVVKKERARILAISTMVSVSGMHLKKLIRELKKEGLRDRFVIITGGPGLNEFYAKKLGADLYDQKAESGAKRTAEFLKKT